MEDSRSINAAIALSNYFRRKRFALIGSIISGIPRPFNLLDVGGTVEFWSSAPFDTDGIVITILNIEPVKSAIPGFNLVTGDARNMKEFKDSQFELVVSNSVLEHVGGFDDQRNAAGEIKRVGQRYLLQTPNRFFPIEPHFFYPFFQFYPRRLKLFLGGRLDIGWFRNLQGEDKRRFIDSLRLLSEMELRQLFPKARIYPEKVLGMTKSFTVYFEK